ncbi:MAG: LLM class flavin-dependent oxidoreductase [Porticoccaceae bacterium]|nr:LLM class flavin-dependent oxidoreductase [Porticoccaceae bacterium]
MKISYMPDTHFGVYDQQPPAPDQAAAAFDQIIAEAVLAEELGFDGIFLPERHARGETFVPSPLIAATAIAARTSRIKIATTVLMPTLYNPMHLAEQIAMIDNLSRGRFILGVGVGYHQDYHRFFGVPWENRGKRFEEVMAILHLAFAGDRFSFSGDYYSFDNVQLTPLTYQRPRIPIWVGTHSKKKPLDRALDHDGWVLWTQTDWNENELWINETRQRAKAKGKNDWTVVLNQDGWIGDDPEKVRQLHAPRWLREANFYAEHDFDADIDPHADHKSRDDELNQAIKDFESRQWHFGTPDSWVERIKTIENRFAPDWLNIRLRTPNPGTNAHYPDKDETLTAIRRFGEEVLPALRRAN